jgi:hypothetical protein
METEKLNELMTELSMKAKNGIDFTLAASIVWLIIAYIWTLKFESYDKAIFVFIAGLLLLPLAFLFSKLFKTNREIVLTTGLYFNSNIKNLLINNQSNS